jgi:hypothetical protein
MGHPGPGEKMSRRRHCDEVLSILNNALAVFLIFSNFIFLSSRIGRQLSATRSEVGLMNTVFKYRFIRVVAADRHRGGPKKLQ